MKDVLQGVFLIGCFLPCIVRSAFWYDSPSPFGILFWLPATWAAVLGSGWLAVQVFGPGVGPTIVMCSAILAVNWYVLREAYLYGTLNRGGSLDDEFGGE